MSNVKISGLPQDASPATGDSVATYDVSATLTKRVLLSDLIALFFNNIPTGAHSDVTRGAESLFDFVASGGVITADSAGVNRNASMSALICYINGRRISILAVAARTYTASKDTYVDVLDNLDGTGTLVYTETTNNAASPALASNSLRIGIVVTGATTIAAAASINQGDPNATLPVTSTNPYTVTDSLGNLICNRDNNRRLLGYRQALANQGSITTVVDMTGMSVPVIVPANRKIELAMLTFAQSTVAGDDVKGSIKEGVNTYQVADDASGAAGRSRTMHAAAHIAPTTGAHTYKSTLERASGTGSVTNAAGAGFPSWIAVRLAN